MRDADRVIGLLQKGEVRQTRIIINRIKPELVRQGGMLDSAEVLDTLGVDAIGLVPADDLVITSSNQGRPVAHNTASPSGREFTRIAARLDGEPIPLIEPIEERNESVSIMDKVRQLMGRGRAVGAGV